MNKAKHIDSWYVLFIIVLTSMLTGCGSMRPTITSTASQAPTPASPYMHYTPSKGSNIYLEFDYPASWVFTEEKIQGTDIIFVGLGDPRLLTVPTRAPNEPHGTPSDFGSISILIQPSKPGQTPYTELEAHKENYRNIHWMTVLDDYKTTVDGSYAAVLEYQSNDPESSPSLMFNRRVYFMINSQLYEIIFTVAEKERGGEFEKGYEYFFDSLKIVS
jgi:hypothetical protein